MFAYCNNNPPRYTDSAGFSVKDCFLENIKDGKIPIGGGGGGGVILKIAGTGLWEAFLSFIFGENEEDIGESAVTGAVSGISDSGLVPKKITVPLLAIYTFYDNLSEGGTPVTGDKFRKALYKTATTMFLGKISLTDDEFNRMSLYIFQAGEDLGIGGIERLAHNFIDNITIEVYKPNYTAPAFGAVGGGARNSYYAFN